MYKLKKLPFGFVLFDSSDPRQGLTSITCFDM